MAVHGKVAATALVTAMMFVLVNMRVAKAKKQTNKHHVRASSFPPFYKCNKRRKDSYRCGHSSRSFCFRRFFITRNVPLRRRKVSASDGCNDATASSRNKFTSFSSARSLQKVFSASDTAIRLHPRHRYPSPFHF
ncbi:hypothetical protein TRVL_07634 [Trypanosoma vivax]|nr:hypothetical protein TRVL_07634 [Trypanosoma vivax]